MDFEKINEEFYDERVNLLVNKLNMLYNTQQRNNAEYCYTIYSLDCWFEDNYDCLLKSKNNQYYNKKQFFKMLNISNRSREYCIQLYLTFMTLAEDENANVFAKIKEPFSCFSFSRLILMLPYDFDALVDAIVNKQLVPEMTCKEIKEFLKTLKEKKYNAVVDENTLSVEYEENEDDEPFFLILKEDYKCRDFLETFKTWGKWYYEERLKVKYYRCIIDKKTLVAVLSFYLENGKEFEHVDYYYLEKNGLNMSKPLVIDEITEFILSTKNKKVILPDCEA